MPHLKWAHWASPAGPWPRPRSAGRAAAHLQADPGGPARVDHDVTTQWLWLYPDSDIKLKVSHWCGAGIKLKVRSAGSIWVTPSTLNLASESPCAGAAWGAQGRVLRKGASSVPLRLPAWVYQIGWWGRLLGFPRLGCDLSHWAVVDAWSAESWYRRSTWSACRRDPSRATGTEAGDQFAVFWTNFQLEVSGSLWLAPDSASLRHGIRKRSLMIAAAATLHRTLAEYLSLSVTVAPSRWLRIEIGWRSNYQWSDIMMSLGQVHSPARHVTVTPPDCVEKNLTAPIDSVFLKFFEEDWGQRTVLIVTSL